MYDVDFIAMKRDKSEYHPCCEKHYAITNYIFIWCNCYFASMIV